MYTRPTYQTLLNRVSEKRRFIQVLAGPRQTGKTTLAHQLLETTQLPSVGQLQEAGNTTTLAHYLDLLKGAGLITGLTKYAGQIVRQRASSPKLLVLNTALMTVQSHLTLQEAKDNHEFWGRLVESSIGAALSNGIAGKNLNLHYWAGRNREVDFILAKGDKLIAFEMKSNLKKTNLPGITAFAKEFRVKKKVLIGADGIPVRKFLQTPVTYWFE